MDNPFVVGLITCIVLFGLFILFLVVASGGDGRRISLAVASFRKALTDADFANRVEPLLIPPPPQPAKPPKPSGVPLRFLALLQRDGRLVDFLLEDIQAYPDPQIGAAVRDIHRNCHAALKEHLVLEPVMNQAEGATVEVPAGFDPSAIRLTGNVTGQPPFRGVLKHHGWRVKDFTLAKPPEGQDEFVVAPAEVELP